MVPALAMVCASIAMLIARWRTVRYVNLPPEGLSLLDEDASAAIIQRCVSVPLWTSWVYLSGAAWLFGAAVWAALDVHWWMLFLMVPLWIVAHLPWRQRTAEWKAICRIVGATAHTLNR